MNEYQKQIRDGFFGWNDKLIDTCPCTEDVTFTEEELSDSESGRIKNSGDLDKKVVGSVFTIQVNFTDINDLQFKQIREIKTTTFGWLDFWYAGELFHRHMSSSSISSTKKRVLETGVTIWDVHLEFSEKTPEQRIKE